MVTPSKATLPQYALKAAAEEAAEGEVQLQNESENETESNK